MFAVLFVQRSVAGRAAAFQLLAGRYDYLCVITAKETGRYTHRLSNKASRLASVAASLSRNDRRLQFSGQVAGAANYAIDQRYHTARAPRRAAPRGAARHSRTAPCRAK